MDPAMIAVIVGAISEAMKFALQGARLLEDGQDMTPEQVQTHWTEISNHYQAARKAWDDAGSNMTETA